MNGSIPVETQLAFTVVRLRLDATRFQRLAVDPRDESALRFNIGVILVGGIGEREESVASAEVFPAAVRDPAGISGIAYPHAVVLQSPVDMIRIFIVDTDVIELRYGQVVSFQPGVPRIVRIPDAAIIGGNDLVGILRIDPNIVKIAMSAPGKTET